MYKYIYVEAIVYGVFNKPNHRELILFISVLYMVVISLLQLRKLKCIDVRKRLIRFIVIGIVFSVLNNGINYIFMPERVDIIRSISIAFGSAFGISFWDLIFFRSKEVESSIDD